MSRPMLTALLLAPLLAPFDRQDVSQNQKRTDHVVEQHPIAGVVDATIVGNEVEGERDEGGVPIVDSDLDDDSDLDTAGNVPAVVGVPGSTAEPTSPASSWHSDVLSSLLPAPDSLPTPDATIVGNKVEGQHDEGGVPIVDSDLDDDSDLDTAGSVPAVVGVPGSTAEPTSSPSSWHSDVLSSLLPDPDSLPTPDGKAVAAFGRYAAGYDVLEFTRLVNDAWSRWKGEPKSPFEVFDVAYSIQDEYLTDVRWAAEHLPAKRMCRKPRNVAGVAANVSGSSGDDDNGGRGGEGKLLSDPRQLADCARAWLFFDRAMRDSEWLKFMTDPTRGKFWKQVEFLRDHNGARALAMPAGGAASDEALAPSLEQQYAELQDGLATSSVQCWRDDPRVGMIGAAAFLKALMGDEGGAVHDASAELAAAAVAYLEADKADTAADDNTPLMERGWPARKGGLHTAFVDVIANTLVQCAVRVVLTSRHSFSLRRSGVHPSVVVAMTQGNGLVKEVLRQQEWYRRQDRTTTRELVTVSAAARTAEDAMFFPPQAPFTGPTFGAGIATVTAHIASLRSCRAPDAPDPKREDFPSHPFPTALEVAGSPYVGHLTNKQALLACAFRWLRLHRFVMTALVRHPVVAGTFDEDEFWEPFRSIAFGQYGAVDTYVRDDGVTRESQSMLVLFETLAKKGYACLVDDGVDDDSVPDDDARVDALYAMDKELSFQKSAPIRSLASSALHALQTGDRAALWPAPDLERPTESAVLLAISSTVSICAMQVARVMRQVPRFAEQQHFRSYITAVALRFAEAHIAALGNSIRATLPGEVKEEGEKISGVLWSEKEDRK